MAVSAHDAGAYLDGIWRDVILRHMVFAMVPDSRTFQAV